MGRTAHVAPSAPVALQGVMARCYKHSFDEAVTTCRDCHHELCDDCVLEIPRIGQLCVPCALVRSGVRRKRPALAGR